MSVQDVLNYLGSSVIAFGVGFVFLSAHRNPEGRVSGFLERYAKLFSPRWWNPGPSKQRIVVAVVCFLISALGVLFALKALGLKYSWGPH